MLRYRKIRVGKKSIEAFYFPLGKKNLVVIRGKQGYIMCGYLNLEVADKLGDVAAKISGVSTIRDALHAKVEDLTSSAEELGIQKGDLVKDVIKLIA